MPLLALDFYARYTALSFNWRVKVYLTRMGLYSKISQYSIAVIQEFENFIDFDWKLFKKHLVDLEFEVLLEISACSNFLEIVLLSTFFVYPLYLIVENTHFGFKWLTSS